MKVRADEHVSPKIVETIRNLVLRDGWEISHVRDDNRARTADETWMPLFAQSGGNAVLTADANILKRPHQILAMQQTGLICVVLSAKWAMARRHEQAACLLYHGPAIESAISASTRGDCWRVPGGYLGETVERNPINFQAAARAAAVVP